MRLCVCVSQKNTLMTDDEDARSVVSSARYSEGGTRLIGGGSSRDRPVEQIAKRVAELLCHEDEVSSKEHLLASEELASLMAALGSLVEVPKQVQVFMMCTISSLFRRVVRMRDDPNASTSAKLDERDFVRTLTLVFAATVSIDLVARSGVPVNPETSERALEESQKGSLWTNLCKFSKRKAIADEIDEFEKRRMELEDLCDRPYLHDVDSSS